MPACLRMLPRLPFDFNEIAVAVFIFQLIKAFLEKGII